MALSPVLVQSHSLKIRGFDYHPFGFRLSVELQHCMLMIMARKCQQNHIIHITERCNPEFLKPDILNSTATPRDLVHEYSGQPVLAFDQFRIKSCIDFKPRKSEEYFLSIQKLNGCFSYIGQVFANGQNLSIGSSCDHLGIVEHEILHALGFYHEQSRYDRSDHIKIVWDNIKEGWEYNFRKVGHENSTTHETSYDYLSVMHYYKSAFTNGNGSTIITSDPKFQDVIGQRLEMSPGDVQELNLLYKCSKCLKMIRINSLTDKKIVNTMCYFSKKKIKHFYCHRSLFF
uniref:Metalloendopeptidase n=1 Tax=Kryptolebias marmoratus TaxID=37003 RepID=A0A3Q3FW15_KRYMA